MMTAAPAIPVTIAGEWPGHVLGRDALLLTLDSPKAFPPGQPLELNLALPAGPLALAARSIGSKQQPDGRYQLRLRLINLKREAREALDRAFPGPQPG